MNLCKKKSLLTSKTFWCAAALPVTSWTIQSINGGILPQVLQTWGPLVVAVGFMLLRLATCEPCIRMKDRVIWQSCPLNSPVKSSP